MTGDGAPGVPGDRAPDAPERLPRLAAVVVHYRRADLLADCLAALAASSRPPDEVLVMENGARDGSAEAIVAGYPGARLIQDAANPGYAAACERGWRATRAQAVLFINPDVRVSGDCLERCLEELQAEEDVGIVTCRLVRADGRLDHACHRGSPTVSNALFYKLRLHRLMPTSRRLGHYTLSWMDPLTVHDVEACSGAFLLARRRALEAVDGWDTAYHFYAEDLDLCLRARQAGMRVRYVGNALATHLKGSSSLLAMPASALGPDERTERRYLRQAVLAAHERYYRLHLADGTSRLLRMLVALGFRLRRSSLGLGRARPDPR